MKNETKLRLANDIDSSKILFSVIGPGILLMIIIAFWGKDILAFALAGGDAIVAYLLSLSLVSVLLILIVILLYKIYRK